MNLKRVIIFDLEMCCWNDSDKSTGEIIEFSLCEVDIETLTVIRSAQYYVKPNIDVISEFCTELTGITPAKIKKQGRPISEVLATIKKKFGSSNKTFVAWGRDDLTIKNELEQKGLSFEMGDYINLANMYRLMNGKQRNCSQLDAMQDEGLEFVGKQHSALADAENLAELFIKMSERARK